MKMRLALSIPLAALLFCGCASLSESMERSLLFHPTKKISLTPQATGMEGEDVFLASGGYKIHGWYFPSAKGGISVIYFHGNGENISQMLGVFKAFAPMEFNLLMVDYRGYGKSEGEPSVDGMVEDALSAVDWMTATRGVLPERIVLWGRSLGASAALCAAEKRPGLGGVIAESGFISLRKIAAHHMPWIPSFLVRDKLDNLKAVGGLAIPKLILHGDRDEVIPVDHGRALYERGAEPKELHILAGAGHNDMYKIGGPGYIGLIKAWIGRL